MPIRRLFVLALLAASTHARDLANCTRQRLCNGDYLCADVCKLGTVVPDTFASRGLALQRALTYDDRLARHTLIGSHNSAISLAYGFGIEMDGFETLLNKTLYDNDDLGEGVDSSFTLKDQLNMGLRHLEIDITAGYFELPWPKPNDFFVCHSPLPLSPQQVAAVEAAALRQGVHLGKWNPAKLSCLETRVPLRTAFLEVKTWLDAHPEEVVVLFLDTKPLTMVERAQANAMSALIRDVFNESVWSARDGDRDTLLNTTHAELIARGKRLYIEDHEDAYNKADDPIVFASAIWSHQFGASDLSAFPACTISGDADWYTNVAGTARPFARGLYDDGSTLHDGGATHDALRANATRCGVNVVSPNYVQPRDMAAFVWTWDAGEPAAAAMGADDEACVVQNANGRWAAVDCDKARAMPLACRKADDDKTWTLQKPSSSSSVAAVVACGAGWLARAPTNGYANGLLRVAAAAAGLGAASVMLNVSTDGRAGSPAMASRRPQIVEA